MQNAECIMQNFRKCKYIAAGHPLSLSLRAPTGRGDLKEVRHGTSCHKIVTSASPPHNDNVRTAAQTIPPVIAKPLAAVAISGKYRCHKIAAYGQHLNFAFCMYHSAFQNLSTPLVDCGKISVHNRIRPNLPTCPCG